MPAPSGDADSCFPTMSTDVTVSLCICKAGNLKPTSSRVMGPRVTLLWSVDQVFRRFPQSRPVSSNKGQQKMLEAKTMDPGHVGRRGGQNQHVVLRRTIRAGTPFVKDFDKDSFSLQPHLFPSEQSRLWILFRLKNHPAHTRSTLANELYILSKT